MAEESKKTLEGLLRKAGICQDEDVLKESIRVFSQALMESEVEERLVADGRLDVEGHADRQAVGGRLDAGEAGSQR